MEEAFKKDELLINLEILQHIPAIDSLSISNSPINSNHTGYIYDARLVLHKNVISSHPEQPARITKIHERIIASGLMKRLVHIPLRDVTDSELELVHEKEYLEWIRSTSFKIPEEYERQSIYYNQYTADCSRWACGGVLELAQYIASGLLRNGMAIVRPPGHHAECNKAMGFCFINYVAVTARYLQKYCKGMKKILIVDWDIHHGNGTQNSFISDPSVLYISLHRYDHGTFFPSDPGANYTNIGTGPGMGRTVNIPWSDDEMGDAEYLHAFHRIIMPIAYEFNPDFTIISCGFDAAEGDPIGDYHISPSCYAHMTHLLMALSNGRVMLSLEGGYSLDALPICTEACIRTLIGEPPDPIILPICPNPSAINTVELVLQLQKKYWNCFGEQENEIDRCIVEYHKEHPLLFAEYSNIISRYWSQIVVEQYGLVKMPSPELEYDIYSSPDILSEEPILIVLHTIGSQIQSSSLLDNNLSRSEEIKKMATLFPGIVYLDTVHKMRYNIIDIVIKDPLQKMNRKESAALYIWDNFLSIGRSRRIFLLGMGRACSNLVTLLVSYRDVSEHIKGCFLFPESLHRPVVFEKAEWFADHSFVFIASQEQIFSPIPFARSYGRCISSGK